MKLSFKKEKVDDNFCKNQCCLSVPTNKATRPAETDSDKSSLRVSLCRQLALGRRQQKNGYPNSKNVGVSGSKTKCLEPTFL